MNGLKVAGDLEKQDFKRHTAFLEDILPREKGTTRQGE